LVGERGGTDREEEVETAEYAYASIHHLPVIDKLKRDREFRRPQCIDDSL